MTEPTKVFEVAPGAILSSIKHGRDFKAGEKIDLSHASDDDIDTLKKAGKIKDIASPAPAKPEKEGK